MSNPDQPRQAIDWSLTTWEGSRREQLWRRAGLSLEDIIRAQEDMREVSERFAQMRAASSDSR